MKQVILATALVATVASGASANGAEKFFKTIFVDVPKDTAHTFTEKAKSIPEWVKSKFHCSGCKG